MSLIARISIRSLSPKGREGWGEGAVREQAQAKP